MVWLLVWSHFLYIPGVGGILTFKKLIVQIPHPLAKSVFKYQTKTKKLMGKFPTLCQGNLYENVK
jgi:hypothetical protein